MANGAGVKASTRLIGPLATAVALAATAVLASCSPARLYEAGRLLRDVVESAPAGPAASRGAGIVYPGPDGPTAADLYLPPGVADVREADAALLLVPGLAPRGPADARLIPFARALSRAGFAVMVPDIAGFRAQRIGPGDVEAIAAALLALDDLRAGPRRRPLGVAAISYAAGPALLATMRPAARGKVDFLLAVGGYYDLTDVLTYFTTGYERDGPGQPWRRGRPNAYGKWVFVRANLDRIADLRDRTTLAAMADRRMADLGAPIDDLAATLGSEGRAVYDLIVNTDPERVPALAARLPAGLRADMAALDLEGRDLSAAPPRILLVHGRDDPTIPAGESVALAAALPAGRAELVIIDSLAHVDLGAAGWR
ncbi:MAG: alpha/beta hydrolase, partial [Rhodospirillaceae bacterium]|nr:alpha/beta hydrolase [Rhodospirillaceae bacterium]